MVREEPLRIRRRILIADDNAEIHEMLGDFFMSEGFEVVHAFDGEEAIRQTAENRPHLVLLDMRMPGEDGLNVVRRVRETDLDTAIVLYTAFGSEALGLEALRAGADDYLKKPVSLEVLIERVNAVIIAKEGHNVLRHRAEQRMRESEELYRATAAELAGRVATIDVTQEIARAVLSDLDLQAIAHTIVTQWRRLLPYDRAYIVLIENNRTNCVVLATYADDIGDSVEGWRFPLADTLLANVGQDRQPLRIADLHSQPELPAFAQRIARAGLRSLLIVPVLVRDRVVAGIHLSGFEPSTFTSRHEELATELVGTASIAIQNALLYRDLRESYKSLERAQVELLRKERLAALGQISAVMAHEVRNPLGVIYNSLGAFRKLLPPGGDAQLLLSIVEEEADRLNRIIGSLLDFARPTTLELTPGDLSALVEDVVRGAVTDSAYRPSIEITAEYLHQPNGLLFDVHLVRQALINLLQNAFQAIEGRGGPGRVALRTEDAEIEGRPYVKISVSDTGGGIPDKVRERIFDPFFTTRTMGTGLGLPIVKRVVEDHSGILQVETRQGEGSTFSILLPRAPRSP
jgi:signal transduction histidine kinase